MTGPSRKIYPYLFLVLLSVLALQHYLIKRGDVTVPVKVGDEPEDVGFDFLDGRRVDLGELEGQIVVLDFWASWCVPCRRQMPMLEEFHDSLKTPDCLRMIAVNVRESEETVEQFLQEFPVGYDVALDPDGIVAKNFRVRSLPTLVVLDTNGEVLWAKEGFEPSLGMALRRRLAKKIPECVAPPTDQMAEALKAMGVDVPDTEADENENERDSLK